MIRLSLALIALLLIGGCAEPGSVVDKGPTPEAGAGRFTAHYQGSFHEACSEHGHGMFLIHDTKTGREWLVVEGCGAGGEITVSDGHATRVGEE